MMLHSGWMALSKPMQKCWGSNGVYDMAGLKPSRQLIADVAIQEKLQMWNVRNMNIGKLNTVKDEMKWQQIDILGISNLRRTWTGHFQSEDHIVYTQEKQSNGITFIATKGIATIASDCNAIHD